MTDYRDAYLTTLQELVTVYNQMARMREAMDRLPEGWSVTKISETKVRIDAMTPDGVMCHWVLDALDG